MSSMPSKHHPSIGGIRILPPMQASRRICTRFYVGAALIGPSCMHATPKELTRYLRPRPSRWILAILPTMVPMRLGCCCDAVVTEVAAAAAVLVPPACPSSLVPCAAAAAAWEASASFGAASDDRSAPPDVPKRAADAILPNMMAENRVESSRFLSIVFSRFSDCSTAREDTGERRGRKMMKQAANDCIPQSSKSNRSFESAALFCIHAFLIR